MAEIVPMLALSPTMEQAVIVKWRKAEGDAVASGDVLCEVETDKAVMEYEASNEGTLLKILLGEGAACGVGDPIGIIGEAGEDIGDLLAEAQKAKKAEPATKPAEQPEAPSEAPSAQASSVATPEPVAQAKPPEPAAAPARSGDTVKASPVARKLAAKVGLDLRTIRGSGPDGRIVKRDVEAAAAGGGTGGLALGSAEAAPELVEQEVAVSPKRKMIADRMAASKQSAPHYYLTVTVAMDELMAARRRVNETAAEKLSLNAFLMAFAARALADHPQVNASWEGATIRRHGRADVALAVAQDDGLIAPVVRDCSRKGVAAIDTELKGLIAKAQAGALSREDYAGATFTITNLGNFGIEQFTGVINQPGSAILAVGEIKPEPAVDADGAIVVRSNMKMTLSCDHRVIDGAVGAAFLSDLKGLLEQPVRPVLVVPV